MPAIICYVTGPGGREVQLRVRASGRVAIPLRDLPGSPRLLALRCPGMPLAELRLVETAHGYAVYYASAADFDALARLVRARCEREPCQLPCSVETLSALLEKSF